MKTLAKENLSLLLKKQIVLSFVLFLIALVYANGQTVCTSSPEFNAHLDITNITFGTINNTSAIVSLDGSQGTATGTAGMYSDWRSSLVPVPSFMQGAMQTFSVTIEGDVNYLNSHRVDVFFDFNHDGDFVDADEIIPVFAYASPTLPNTSSVNINIPITAATGNTVMRVICTNLLASPSCGIYKLGETEDYTINITAAPACSGTPVSGNTLASSSSVCSGETFTLFQTDTYTGQTYQWQSSANGVSWTDITGATSATFSMSQTAGTYYHCIATCTSSGFSATSASLLVSVNSFIDCLCPSFAEDTFGTDIINITFGTINNTSPEISLTGTQGNATGREGSYSDWKSSTIPVPSFMQGTTSAISVKIGSFYEFWHRIDVYIDFNHDADFVDEGELIPVFAYAYPPFPNTATASITIPLTALTGNTVMRVVCIEETFTYSCGGYLNGETEDYLINITPAPPCSGTPTGGTATASTLAGCSGNTGEISVTGSDVAIGLTYQWYSSPVAGGPWTPIPGATEETYAPTTYGHYFLREVVCASSGLSSNSSSFLYNSSSPANDECANATILTVNPSPTCTDVTPGTVACASASSVTNLCNYVADDDVWFKFIATNNIHIISILNAAGSTTDMFHAVYSGTCGSLNSMECSSDDESILTNLVIGQTYFVRVWTFTTDAGQTSTFDVCVASPPLPPVQAPCTNLGFENGFTGWYGTAGHTADGPADASFPSYVPEVFNTTTTSQHAIVTSGTDPYGLFPVVYSGNASARIGDLTIGGSAGSIEQTFSVTTANTDFSYSYAVVLVDGGHEDEIQPFFSVGVYDQNGNEITCSMYLMVAPGTGYIQSTVPASDFDNSVYYKPWSTVSVNLTSYVGQNVTIKFIASDCSWHGHFGYAYIDCACAPFEINTTPNPAVICEGEPATLTAPSGALSYSWSTGESTQAITIHPTTTTTYTCNMTTSGITPCPAELSTTVTVNADITPTFTQLGPYCAGAIPDVLPTTSNNGVTGTWNPATIDNLSSGTYTFTPDAGECASTQVLNVTVTSQMMPDFASIAAFCSGSVAPVLGTISPNGISGIWSPAIIDNLSSGTYTFTPDAGECATTQILNVTVNQAPLLTFVSPICSTEMLTYTVTFTSTAGTISASSGTISGSTVTGIAAGTDITITADNNGCVTTLDVSAPNCACPTINPPTNPTNPLICEGAATPALTVDAAAAGYQINWYALSSGGAVLATNSNSYTPTDIAAGTYSYYAETEETVSGCKSIRTEVVLTITPQMIPDFASIGDFCSGSVAPTLGYTSPNGISGTWSPAIIDNLSSGTYTFTPNAGECASTQVLNVTVTSQMIPDFASIPDFCSGSAAPVLASTSPNGISGTWSPATIDNLSSGTYTFTPDEGECATTQTLNVTVNQAPVLTFVSTICSTDMLTYTVTFTSTAGTITASSGTVSGSTVTGIAAGTDITITANNNGCDTTLHVFAPICACPTINPPTNPTNPSICEGAATPALTVDATAAGYQINWYALSSGGVALATNNNSYTPTDIAAGTYSYYAETEETVSGCKSIRTAVVLTINSNPAASVTGTDVLCFGGSTGSADLNVSGGTPNYTFEWSNGAATEDLTGITSGIYFITVTDVNGCTDTDTVFISEPAILTASVTASSDQSCSVPGSATLEGAGGTAPYIYTWPPNAGGVTTGTSTSLTAGLYVVTVTDANGCTASAIVTIGELNGFMVSVSSQNDACRQGIGTASVIASGGDGSYTYLWDSNPPQTTAIATGLTAGNYTVSVFSGMCSATATVTVNNTPGPDADISLSPSVVTILDGMVDFSGNSSDNIADWQWSFGDGSSGNGQTVQYQYQNIGAFMVTLIVTDDNGCIYTVTDSVIVKNIFTLYIPNAFTPNDDGNNDLFMPQGLNVDPENYTMQIFDRWGNLIFETNTWGEGWNGTKYNLGSWEDAVQGAYVYKISAKEANKRLHNYVGTVVILK